MAGFMARAFEIRKKKQHHIEKRGFGSARSNLRMIILVERERINQEDEKQSRSKPVSSRWVTKEIIKRVWAIFPKNVNRGGGKPLKR